MAVAAGRVESARFFLESGADVRGCTSEMKNCVHLAVENGHLEMVELLLENTEVTENLYRSDAWERVPLHNAAISPNIKVSNFRKVFKDAWYLLLLLRIRSAHLGMCLLKPGLHVRRKYKHKKPTCKPVRRKHKRLVLALVLMLASSWFTHSTKRRQHKHKRMGRNGANISTSTKERNDFHVCLCLRRTCKPGRRKHKHKRKERKLKNSDKLSVTHALPFAKWRQHIFMLLRMRMSLMLMLIARVNIVVLMLVLMLMIASYV